MLRIISILGCMFFTASSFARIDQGRTQLLENVALEIGEVTCSNVKGNYAVVSGKVGDREVKNISVELAYDLCANLLVRINWSRGCTEMLGGNGTFDVQESVKTGKFKDHYLYQIIRINSIFDWGKIKTCG